jgi:anti-sigma regulatory factor (Ser/Thr protein kinase)
MTHTPTATTTERDFPARTSCLTAIREFIGDHAAGLAVAEDAVMAGSELAANSIEHASPCGGAITVTVTVTGATVRIDVTDCAPASLPRIRDAYGDEEAQRGRGLLIIDALSSDWGCDVSAQSKTTWCEMRLGKGTLRV